MINAALALSLTLAAATTLTGFASLPAETFVDGPSAGSFADDGSRRAPRFERQPVQGVSAIAPAAKSGQWWALSDNGFGTRANSGDYRLALYLFKVQPVTRPDRGTSRTRASRVKGKPTVELLQRIELRDPGQFFPWPLTLDRDPQRPLTGADVDPESLVMMDDGSFWVGDEHGPWLLHFAADGSLLAAPVEFVPGGVVLRSAAHPEVVNGGKPAVLKASRGFEGLAKGTRPGTLIAMLEASVDADAPNEVRMLELDTTARAWTGRRWRYRMDDAAHSISEIVRDPFTGNDTYLVIERDDQQGANAKFKKIFRVHLDSLPAKTQAIDLLQIDDPQRLGGGGAVFRFPFLTTEALWPTAFGEIVVVNDNNFPASGGRSTTAPDPTEWIFLRE